MVRTVKRQFTEPVQPRDEDISYNPMRYSSSSANITLDTPPTALPPASLPKEMKDMSVASSTDGFSQISLPGLMKSQSQMLPAASPRQSREHVIENQTGGDATITIPKITYSHDDFGSDDEEEEDSEAVAKVERKYYRK